MSDETLVSAEVKLQSLQPYLERLAAELEASGGAPPRVVSEGLTLEVNSWEHEALRLVFQPEDGMFPELDAVLVAEGLALRLKAAADLAALETAGVSLDESGEQKAVDSSASGGEAGAADDESSLDELAAFLSGGDAKAEPEGEEIPEEEAAAETGGGDDAFDLDGDEGVVEGEEGPVSDDVFGDGGGGPPADEFDDPFGAGDEQPPAADSGDVFGAEAGQPPPSAAGDVFGATDDPFADPMAPAPAGDVFDVPADAGDTANSGDVFAADEPAVAEVEDDDPFATEDRPPLDVGLEDDEVPEATEAEPAPEPAAEAEEAPVEPPSEQAAEVPPELLQQLTLDVAIGNGLMVDIQRVMNALVGGGQMEAANRLTRFRHNIRHDITRVQRTLDALAEAETDDDDEARRAAAAYRWDAETQDIELSEAEKAKAAGAARRKKRREEITKVLVAQKRRIAIMGAVAAALFVVWAIFVWLPSTRVVKLEVLTLDDFSGIPEILAVESRPPSIYFTVDRKRWEKKSDDDKLKMLRSVGFILARSDYTAAQFWDDRGRNVGEWFKGGTTRIIVPPPPSTGGT